MTARTLPYAAVHQLDLGRQCDDDLINAKYTGVESYWTPPATECASTPRPA